MQGRSSRNGSPTTTRNALTRRWDIRRRRPSRLTTEWALFAAHHRLACPAEEWERLKIGGGAPRIMCRHGWLMLYHGVHDLPQMNTGRTARCVTQPARWCYRRSIRTGLFIVRRSPCSFPKVRSSARVWSRTSCFPPASIVATILTRPIASTSITAWRTIELAWRVWTCRRRCHTAQPPAVHNRRRTRLSYVAFARRAGAGCVGPRAGSRQTGIKMPVGRQDVAAATPNIAAVAVANKNGSWRTLKERRLIDQATLTALKSRLARTASI